MAANATALFSGHTIHIRFRLCWSSSLQIASFDFEDFFGCCVCARKRVRNDIQNGRSLCCLKSCKSSGGKPLYCPSARASSYRSTISPSKHVYNKTRTCRSFLFTMRHAYTSINYTKACARQWCSNKAIAWSSAEAC